MSDNMPTLAGAIAEIEERNRPRTMGDVNAEKLRRFHITEAGYPDLKSLQSTDRNTLERKADARVRRMGAKKIIQELLNTDDSPHAAEKYGARLDARRFLKLTEGRPDDGRAQ